MLRNGSSLAQDKTAVPVRVRSSLKPSTFHSLMVLSEDVVASCLASGLRQALQDMLTCSHEASQYGRCVDWNSW